jgi:hypothetical protein
MTENDISMLDNALPLSEYLPDGRVKDIATGRIDYNNESSVYLIFFLSPLSISPPNKGGGKKGGLKKLF